MNKVQLRQLKLAFYSHRHKATKNGRRFLLTFEQWLKIWVDSGHLHERGRKRGQYVMARHGDKGPYAIGNVRICTVTENYNEFHIGRPLSEAHKQNLSKKFKGRRISKAQRLKLSKAHKGKKLTQIHKDNIGKAVKGAKNPNAHLTQRQVDQMRELRNTRGLDIITLGKMFGVSKSTAWNIIRGACYV